MLSVIPRVRKRISFEMISNMKPDSNFFKVGPSGHCWQLNQKVRMWLGESPELRCLSFLSNIFIFDRGMNLLLTVQTMLLL